MSEENLKQLRADLKKAERNSSRIYVRLKKLREQTPLKVSDHALVRYLERVEDIPVEEAREKLLSPVVIECYQLLGNGTFPIDREGSARVVVIDGVIYNRVRMKRQRLYLRRFNGANTMLPGRQL